MHRRQHTLEPIGHGGLTEASPARMSLKSSKLVPDGHQDYRVLRYESARFITAGVLSKISFVLKNPDEGSEAT